MFLSTSQNNLLLRPGNLACTCKRPLVGTRDQPALAWVCWDTLGRVGCGWAPLPGCPGGRCLGYGVASVRSGEQDLPSRGHGSSRKGPSLGSPPGSPCRERGQGRRCAPPHELWVPEPDPTSWGAKSPWSRNINLSALTKPQVFERKTHAHPGCCLVPREVSPGRDMAPVRAPGLQQGPRTRGTAFAQGRSHSENEAAAWPLL